MRASYLVSLLYVAITFSASAQSFDWVATAGSAKSDKTRCIQLDEKGNMLLAGELGGDGKFGDIEVKSAGGMDFFVAKVSPTGKFLWAHSLGGSLVDRGYGVVADKQGDVYVTGHYQSTDVMVEGKALTNVGDYDLFVAKYDPDGKLLWIRTAGSKGYDYGHGIVVDGNGDVIITGAVAGEAKFEDQTITGSRPIFCAKYTSEGKLVWVRASEGKASCSGHGVAVDGANNIYLGGLSSGVGSFGKCELNTEKGSSGMVAKLSPAGEVLWVTLNTGVPSGGVHEITADSAGRVWVAGMFKGSIQLGDLKATTSSDKDNDGYVAHFDTDGKLLWTQVLHGPETDYMLGVAADGRGGVFATGEHSNGATLAGRTMQTDAHASIFVASFGPKGELRWLEQAGGSKGGNAYTMAFDGKQTLMFAGACTGPGSFGKVTVGVTQGADLYGAKMTVK